jgi:hypothetical protein
MTEENTAPEMEASESSIPQNDEMIPRSSVENALSALKKERSTRKELERQVKEVQSQLERFAGKDPDEWDKIQAEAAETARQRLEMNEQRQLIEEKYGAQAAQAAKEAEAAKLALSEYQKKYALEKIFYSAGGRTDSADGISFFDMMAQQIGGNFRQEPDGSLTVVDTQGDPVLDTESGKRVSPEDYLATFKVHPIYGTFFKGAKGSGSGIGYGGTDANGVVTDDWSSLSSTEKFLKAFPGN